MDRFACYLFICVDRRERFIAWQIGSVYLLGYRYRWPGIFAVYQRKRRKRSAQTHAQWRLTTDDRFDYTNWTVSGSDYLEQCACTWTYACLATLLLRKICGEKMPRHIALRDIILIERFRISIALEMLEILVSVGFWLASPMNNTKYYTFMLELWPIKSFTCSRLPFRPIHFSMHNYSHKIYVGGFYFACDTSDQIAVLPRRSCNTYFNPHIMSLASTWIFRGVGTAATASTSTS